MSLKGMLKYIVFCLGLSILFSVFGCAKKIAPAAPAPDPQEIKVTIREEPRIELEKYEKEEEVVFKAPEVWVVGTWEKDRACLWNIAGDPAVFGDPFKWRKLYNRNKDQILDPDLIYPGQKLFVPRDR